MTPNTGIEFVLEMAKRYAPVNIEVTRIDKNLQETSFYVKLEYTVRCHSLPEFPVESSEDIACVDVNSAEAYASDIDSQIALRLKIIRGLVPDFAKKISYTGNGHENVEVSDKLIDSISDRNVPEIPKKVDDSLMPTFAVA